VEIVGEWQGWWCGVSWDSRPLAEASAKRSQGAFDASGDMIAHQSTCHPPTNHPACENPPSGGRLKTASRRANTLLNPG
jgi:hypothetical protein